MNDVQSGGQDVTSSLPEYHYPYPKETQKTQGYVLPDTMAMTKALMSIADNNTTSYLSNYPEHTSEEYQDIVREAKENTTGGSSEYAFINIPLIILSILGISALVAFLRK